MNLQVRPLKNKTDVWPRDMCREYGNNPQTCILVVSKCSPPRKGITVFSPIEDPTSVQAVIDYIDELTYYYPEDEEDYIWPEDED